MRMTSRWCPLGVDTDAGCCKMVDNPVVVLAVVVEDRGTREAVAEECAVGPLPLWGRRVDHTEKPLLPLSSSYCLVLSYIATAAENDVRSRAPTASSGARSRS